MKKHLLYLCLSLLSFAASAANTPSFTVCNSKYALCTKAFCSPIAGKPGYASCACEVKTGYSVGTKSCLAVKNDTHNQSLDSRYYPITSYASCSNERPWAWCLDSPCKIDPKDPNKAACLCSIVKNLGDYVVVSDNYNKSICDTGLYSSALVVQSQQITDFLKGQSELQPLPIQIYHPTN